MGRGMSPAMRSLVEYLQQHDGKATFHEMLRDVYHVPEIKDFYSPNGMIGRAGKVHGGVLVPKRYLDTSDPDYRSKQASFRRTMKRLEERGILQICGYGRKEAELKESPKKRC